LGEYYDSALNAYMTADTLRQQHLNSKEFELAAQSLSEKIQQCQNALQNR